jgi:hypothetical protein
MTNRSPIYLLARMFGYFFMGALLISLFFNGLSGMNMFPFPAVIGVAVVLTILCSTIGATVVTVGSQIFLKNDQEFQEWKKKGGRPYWDYLGWPINTATPIERQTGLAEPKYPPGRTPPDHFRYQCPQCGARVEKQIDICPLCHYGANGDDTAYRKRWGTPPGR